MSRHDLRDLKDRFTKYAAIGFAAAAIEIVIDDGNSFGDLHPRLRQMLDEVWRLSAQPPVTGRKDMTEQEARSLPSARLYAHTRDLLEICAELELHRQSHPRAYQLAYGAFANLLFMIWLLDGMERFLNPGKPLVVGSDISDTNWTAFVDGLERLVDAAAKPKQVFEWQKTVADRLAREHPYTPAAFIGIPLGPAYFNIAGDGWRSTPERHSLPALEENSKERLRLDELEERITEYAAIALATGTIEKLLAPAREFAGLHFMLAALVAELWAWQADRQSSREETRSAVKEWPSAHFHQEIKRLELEGRKHGQERAQAILAASSTALGFISWMMDGIERRTAPDKPYELDEAFDDRGWGLLIDAFEHGVKASAHPDSMLAWEREAISKLRAQHGSDSGKQTLGEPLVRDAFRDIIHEITDGVA